MIKIWDLDGTVICSKHRQATLPCGNLDLEHWVANNTPIKIMRDRLLPLVNEMRRLKAEGFYTVICTARVLGLADYRFFLNNNVPFDKVLSRPKGCTTPDAELKEQQLTRLFAQMGLGPTQAEMWDDNASVLAMCKRIGIKANDARRLNYWRE